MKGVVPIDPHSGHRPHFAGAVFDILWICLADIMGTAAAATLLRRAAKRAVAAHPELVELSIIREGLEYRCSLPRSWSGPSDVGLASFAGLVHELEPLLVGLTGTVVVQRLCEIPELEQYVGRRSEAKS